jgi:hypothetical protein
VVTFLASSIPEREERSGDVRKRKYEKCSIKRAAELKRNNLEGRSHYSLPYFKLDMLFWDGFSEKRGTDCGFLKTAGQNMDHKVSNTHELCYAALYIIPHPQTTLKNIPGSRSNGHGHNAEQDLFFRIPFLQGAPVSLVVAAQPSFA